ncbi:MAG: L-2-amino-thiazoline-4-carboxylic acid hydrolase [Pseudomonadota bacterium]
MTPAPIASLLCDAIKDRARIYLAVFRELSLRYGEEEAIGVMRSASRAHGCEVGRALAHLGPADFAGMAEQWARAPDGGATFSPEIRELERGGIEVKMMTCPLKDAWIEAGCSGAEVCTLLYCASAFDEAALEGAGFGYDLELWSPGKDGCCRTRIFEKVAE